MDRCTFKISCEHTCALSGIRNDYLTSPGEWYLLCEAIILLVV